MHHASEAWCPSSGTCRTKHSLWKGLLLQTKVDRGSVCLVVRALAVSLSAPGPRLGGGREYQQTSPCPLVDDLGGQQHWFSLKPKSGLFCHRQAWHVWEEDAGALVLNTSPHRIKTSCQY